MRRLSIGRRLSSRRIGFGLLLVLVTVGGWLTDVVHGGDPIQVASKKFTEGALLGEIATLTLRAHGHEAFHRSRLGGTTVCFSSLESGAIDVYADYTGTLLRELLADLELVGLDALRSALADRGIGMTEPLGFDNTYAMAVRRGTAESKKLSRISDLADHPELKLGFGPEFIARQDCWPGLRQKYVLEHSAPISIQHELAYSALDSEEIDVIEVYTTDAKISRFDITILEDDRSFFPRYQAVYLYRLDLTKRHPEALAALIAWEGKISAQSMRELNARVELEGESEASAAAGLLAEVMQTRVTVEESTLADRLLRRTGEHLFLVGTSLFFAVLFGTMLGVVCFRRARSGALILGVVGVIQTIPSLALLVLMIPLLGIDAPPAIAALFLYGLLPIVRGTYDGLRQIPPDLVEASHALGLSRSARHRRIELPLAMPSILSGVKVSAVLLVGFATLGAFIGAGGYGAPILTGIDLQNTPMILEGALPAAGLAIIVQLGFAALERVTVSPGLRLTAASASSSE